MNIEDIATKADIEALKTFFLQALHELKRKQELGTEKEYLRTKDVRQLLGVSSGTLMNLRVKGLLNPVKLDSIYYYKLSEIKTLLGAESK